MNDLTEKEWLEISTLDYILTFNYTDNYNKDLERYNQLVNKRKQNEFQRTRSIK